MDNRYTDNGIPIFDGQDGQNYEMWNIRMKTFLQAQGILCLEISCYRIHHFKETKDCNQEGIEKKQQNSNGFHPGRIT
jgi:hypothetical protein